VVAASVGAQGLPGELRMPARTDFPARSRRPAVAGSHKRETPRQVQLLSAVSCLAGSLFIRAL